MTDTQNNAPTPHPHPTNIHTVAESRPGVLSLLNTVRFLTGFPGCTSVQAPGWAEEQSRETRKLPVTGKDGEAWHAAVHGAAKNWVRLSN